MMSWWQELPFSLDPVALAIGSFDLHWYGLLWLLGFFGIRIVLSMVLSRDGRDVLFREKILDGLFWAFIGAFIGGRMGYALLYAPGFFLENPSALFLPMQEGVFNGFSGMSFFGGVLGVISASWIFFRKQGIPFFVGMDLYTLTVPIGLFFGRIGNFMNGELFGRETGIPWGMYFPGGGSVLRHPSQLYEAFLEGGVLFFVLFITRKKTTIPGMLSAFFLFGYGVLRFFVELFREPGRGEVIFSGMLTLGQVYGCIAILVSAVLFFSIRPGKNAILRG